MITRLTTELKLSAAASTPQEPQSPGNSTSLTFHGPVGVVQTGQGSTATVHQNIDAGVKNDISVALQLLLTLLDQPENDSLGNKAELRELVLDAKAEAEKPQPNNLKLGSSLRAIAETTKFVGSLAPAYQVVKPMLSYFGIHLP